MIKQIFEILTLLILLVTPMILYRNMHKGKHEVSLFLGYIIPFVYLFLKQYLTKNEIKLNMDTLIFILIVWMLSYLTFSMYNVICEMYCKRKDDKENR